MIPSSFLIRTCRNAALSGAIALALPFAATTLHVDPAQNPPATPPTAPPGAPGAPAGWSGQGRGGGRGNNAGAPLYAQFCASCHGPTLQGGAATSLVDEVWKFGGDDASIAASIRDGRPPTAMTSFKDLINDEQI